VSRVVAVVPSLLEPDVAGTPRIAEAASAWRPA